MKFKIVGFIILILWLMPPPVYGLEIPARNVFWINQNGVRKNLDLLLDKIVPKSSSVDLSDLVATAQELNALSGINTANVTASNLNALTGGGTTALHSHTVNVTDASTLDSLDSTQFLRSDVSDTFEGTTLTINGDVTLASGGTIASDSNGDIALNPVGTGALTIGTTTDDTALTLRGDITITGSLYNPQMMELFATTKQLSQAFQQLKTTGIAPQTLREFDYVFERGEERLTLGEAVIPLSSAFLEQVESSLFVKTTLLSADCNELAVVERASTYFRVKELYGGTSNCPFLWEASAKRRKQ